MGGKNRPAHGLGKQKIRASAAETTVHTRILTQEVYVNAQQHQPMYYETAMQIL